MDFNLNLKPIVPINLVVIIMLTGGTLGVHALEQYKFIEKWGSFGTGNGQFERPHDVAFDSKGNVYVSGRDNNIQKFTHNGTFILKWGSKGSGNGQGG